MEPVSTKRVALRLNDADRAAVASIAAALHHPMRPTPTLTQVVRQALATASVVLTGAGVPR